MSAHHHEQIAKNTGRIATALEGILEDSRAALAAQQNMDVNKLIHDAMNALRESNPAFDLAFKQMEKQIESGEIG